MTTLRRQKKLPPSEEKKVTTPRRQKKATTLRRKKKVTTPRRQKKVYLYRKVCLPTNVPQKTKVYFCTGRGLTLVEVDESISTTKRKTTIIAIFSSVHQHRVSAARNSTRRDHAVPCRTSLCIVVRTPILTSTNQQWPMDAAILNFRRHFFPLSSLNGG